MQDPELEDIEEIYDALDTGNPEQALSLAKEKLTQLPDDDPVLRFLSARALLDMDRLDQAIEELQRAVELDPDDAEFRADLGEALYHACRFDESLAHLEKAVALEDAFADAHYVLALLLERKDEHTRARRHFERAAELDDERLHLPCRVDDEEFGRQLELARAALPEKFRKHLEGIGVLVELLPAETLLREDSPPLSPELLGLFTGVTLEGQSYLSPGGDLPPRIYLFKRNLERTVRRPDELAEQIRVTLYHELGHYLGLDEDDLEQAGYA